MRSARLVQAIAAVAIAAAAWVQGAVPGFIPLGDLSGQGLSSEARAVSADGAVVVGSTGTAAGQRGFAWTAAGMTVLPVPSGQTMGWATGVSADGSYISGYAGKSFGTAAGWEGLRWGPAGAMDRIVVSGAGVWAKSISADGQRIVGSSGDEAFLWTPQAGLERLGGLGEPPYRSNAAAISADGNVIVGDSVNLNPVLRDVFRWTREDGMESLGGFTANAVSRDGSAIVGTISTGPHFEAVRWTADGGYTSLGYFRETYHSRAFGVSGDGTIAVGYVECDATEESQASIWDIHNGTRILKDVLEQDYGLDLTGWSLTRAWAISDDGSTIVGRAIGTDGREQGFVATIAPPRPPEWSSESGGDFGAFANWTGGVPNAIGASANFLGSITAPAVVEVDDAFTVAHVNFANSNSYTLRAAQAAGSLTLRSPAGPASINVVAGQHTVQVPMSLASDTELTVAADAALNAAAAFTVADGRTLTKLGPGSLRLVGALLLGDGSALRAEAGEIRAAAISGGTVSIASDAAVVLEGSGVSDVRAFDIGLGGTLDVGEGGLIVRDGSAELASILRERIAAGRNGGAWDGAGLTSSTARAADGSIGVAMILNRDASGHPILDEFAGLPVAIDAILIAVTLNGDTDLSGAIDGDDFFRLDAGYLGAVPQPGYADGDFDYDGLVDGRDYLLIDAAFLAQEASITGAAAVPEPGTGGALSLLAAGILARRRSVWRGHDSSTPASQVRWPRDSRCT